MIGNGDDYERGLLNWLHDSGFEMMETPFSIFDTTNGTEHDKIIVKSQVNIKDGRIC